MKDSYLFTHDLLERYNISRKTLFKWRSAESMPKGFQLPFPDPDLPGNPNRWRSSTVRKWEFNATQKH